MDTIQDWKINEHHEPREKIFDLGLASGKIQETKYTARIVQYATYEDDTYHYFFTSYERNKEKKYVSDGDLFYLDDYTFFEDIKGKYIYELEIVENTDGTGTQEELEEMFGIKFKDYE